MLLFAHSAMCTMQELIFKIPNKKQETIDSLERQYKDRFKTMFHSITMDNVF